MATEVYCIIIHTISIDCTNVNDYQVACMVSITGFVPQMEVQSKVSRLTNAGHILCPTVETLSLLLFSTMSVCREQVDSGDRFHHFRSICHVMASSSVRDENVTGE